MGLSPGLAQPRSGLGPGRQPRCSGHQGSTGLVGVVPLSFELLQHLFDLSRIVPGQAGDAGGGLSAGFNGNRVPKDA